MVEDPDDEHVDDRAAVIQLAPLLVAAPIAARICGVSERTWRKLDRSGRVPTALHWGKRKVWRVEELRRWTEAGCPSREHWKLKE